MRDAILSAVQSGRTSGMAAMIVRTRQINGMLGTSLAPWELLEIPDDWLTALEMWADDYPRAAAWKKQTDDALTRLRSKRAQ